VKERKKLDNHRYEEKGRLDEKNNEKNDVTVGGGKSNVLLREKK